MLTPGSAKKLVVYISERAKWQHEPAYKAILRFLHSHGCAGATVTRAVAGFGGQGRYRIAKLFQLRDDVPMRIEVIESEQKISALLPWIYEMVSGGLIEVQDTEIIKCGGNHEPEPNEPRQEHVKLEGRAKMLRIYIDEDDKWEGEPLYEAIVKRLRMMDLAGATVYQGILGYGAHQRMHRSGFLGIKRNLPLMITVVDNDEKVRQAVIALDEMVDQGLVVLSDVEVIKYVHSRRAVESDERP